MKLFIIISFRFNLSVSGTIPIIFCKTYVALLLNAISNSLFSIDFKTISLKSNVLTISNNVCNTWVPQLLSAISTKVLEIKSKSNLICGYFISFMISWMK